METLFQSVCTFFYITMLSQIGEKIAYNMRCDLFSAIVKQDISFFDQQRTGEVINRYLFFKVIDCYIVLVTKISLIRVKRSLFVRIYRTSSKLNNKIIDL